MTPNKPKGLAKIWREVKRLFHQVLYYSYRRGRVPHNYRAVLQRLKKKRPLHVLFIVHDCTKWNAQSVYDELEKDPIFTVQVVVVPGFPNEDGTFDTDSIEKDYLFFQHRNMNVSYGIDFDTKKTIAPQIFSPDIVFFQEKLSMHTCGEGYTPWRISKYALTCYIPYGVMAVAICQWQYNQKFHLALWRYFCETPLHLEMAKKYMDNKGANVVATGYPKMDSYFDGTNTFDDSVWKLPKKEHPHVKRLIWAPHWTLREGLTTSLSTFPEYHRKMFEFTRDRRDIEVILKPHPNLKRECIKRGVLSQLEIDDYLAAWSNLPNGSVMEEGNYMDMFKSSDAMILDSISFISEYLPTGKPLCFLCKNKDILSTNFNEYGQIAVNQLYEAHSWEDVLHFVDDVVLRGNDPLCERRNHFLSDVLSWTNKPASENILEHLKKQIS